MSETLSHRQLRQFYGSPPRLAETNYDRVVSWQLTLVCVLALCVAGLVAVWLCRELPIRPAQSITLDYPEIVKATGASSSSALVVESPDLFLDDPAVSNDQSEVNLESEVDRATQAAKVASAAAQLKESAAVERVKSAENAMQSGLTKFGSGNSVVSGRPVEQRWLIEYAGQADLKSYASVLSFFNIEIAIVYPDDKMIYLGDPSGENRIVKSDLTRSDDRLYMSWTDNQRRSADLDLLNAAGISTAGNVRVLHFFSHELEQQLKKLERDFGGKPASQIRRTVFGVRQAGAEFQFYVLRQDLLW